MEKERKKKGKMAKSLKLLEACKKWGGPVTENSVNLLEDLDKEQLITEVKYMRLTIAPNIREKGKKVTNLLNLIKLSSYIR